MKLIVFKTLNAPAKAGGFNQLIENKELQKPTELRAFSYWLPLVEKNILLKKYFTDLCESNE
jgi:hypothetical protein